VLFADRAEHALAAAERRGETAALVYLDLDGFKAVNDRFGHETGDRVLVAVAERLREWVRAGDTLARLSGDEFVLLVEDAKGEAGALAAGARLLDALRSPLRLGSDGEAVSVSASAGVALSAPGDTVDELLRRADAAMYGAKADGKDRCALAPPVRSRV
jgi:diguanylate cyclase (GGDEF)-like protein